MKLIKNIVKRFSELTHASERGSILILAGLSTLIIFGSAGLAVDVGRLYAARAELTRSVDAAALAGVLEFNGTAGGLTNAQTKAQAYFTANEPSIPITCPPASNTGGVCITADGATNKMTINASKPVRMYFLTIFGLNNATVSKKAVAGFQDQTIDAVMVIDSTGSMTGTPINNAKTAANNFKNTLLGTSPSGNVVVGVAPFRGCYRASSPTATAPMPTASSACVQPSTDVVGLSSNLATIASGINANCPSDSCVGGSGTNVCNGLAKGWEVLEGAGNHLATVNNRRYMVILTDGDNRYTGSYSYQSSPYTSPHTYQTLPCRPPTSCANVGGDTIGQCRSAVFSPGVIPLASDDFESNTFTGGTGWGAGWSVTNTPTITNAAGTAQGGTKSVALNQTDAMWRYDSLSTATNANLYFWVRTGGTWATSDRFYAEVSTTGTSGWTTLGTYGITGGTIPAASVINATYKQMTVSLTSYVGQPTVYVRFRANTSSTTKIAYVDTVTITDPNTDDSGFINGDDNSNDCGAAVKRERQLDMITRDMATGIKADNIEIFVVAFGICSDTTSYVPTAAECTGTTGSSYIGNTDADATADQRLLKCIASSRSLTNDHYFFAAAATDLPGIFTTIAAQIAHRLVE